MMETVLRKRFMLKGVGVQNMRTRVTILKGVMEIDSKKGVGTYINITIPIEYKAI